MFEYHGILIHIVINIQTLYLTEDRILKINYNFVYDFQLNDLFTKNILILF